MTRIEDLTCDSDSCGKPITGEHWYHHRLRAHVHGGDCLRSVKGEDVTNHCMTLLQAPSRQS